MRERLIGYCGLVCSDCEAFLATQDNDNDQRATVAELWSKLYDVDIKPRDINCDGCITENCRHFKRCSTCEIRQCAKGRAIANCAYCEDYACEMLTAFFGIAPGTKATLDELRASRHT